MSSRHNFNYEDPIFQETEFAVLVGNAMSIITSNAANGDTACGELAEVLPREFGNYQLLERIGQGGMGRVYLARQFGAERLVALKIIRPDLADNWASARRIFKRFSNESIATATIEHENIVTVFDVGEVDQQPYYSMKFIEGESLGDIIADGPLSNQRAASILNSIARGVHAAHQSGVLHRDIKPDNIMIDQRGRPFVMDFGLATSTNDGSRLRTNTGALLGTVSYMSPEQARNPSLVDATSDVYSLGAVLYAMLTGRPPFDEASTLETLRQLHDQLPASPVSLNTDVAIDLETICLKCLNKKPSERYGSAQLLADDLTRFIRLQPIAAKRAGFVDRTNKWIRRNPTIAALATLLVLSVIAGVLAMLSTAAAAKEDRLEQLASSILTIEVSGLPAIIEELNNDWDASLRSLIQAGGNEDSFRINLALFDQEPGCETQLAKLLPTRTAAEVGALARVLEKSPTDIDVDTWIAEAVRQNQYLPFAGLMANYRPDHEVLESQSAKVAEEIATLDSYELKPWLNLLMPIGDKVAPHLWKQLSNSRDDDLRGAVCTAALAELRQDELDDLLNLLAVSSPKHLASLWPKLYEYSDLLDQELAEFEFSDVVDESLQDALTQKVNFHLARIQILDDPASWHALGNYRDPDLHVLMIQSLAECDLSLQRLHERLLASQDSDELYAILLVLGDIPYYGVEAESGLMKIAWELFHAHPDPGVHSAAERLLNRWGVGETKLIDMPLSETAFEGKADGSGSKAWYRTVGEHTMAVVPAAGPVEFVWPRAFQESNTGKTEVYRTTIQLGSFSISTKEVTRQQLEQVVGNPIHNEEIGPTGQHPANNVTFVLAAKYCNALSKIAGLAEDQYYYDIQPDGTPNTFEDAGTRTGFRLPTESEWEWANGCGLPDSTCFGRRTEFANDYAWQFNNAGSKTHVVARLKPNRFGLFDVFGNVQELAHRQVEIKQSPQFKAFLETTKGGSFESQPETLDRRLTSPILIDFSFHSCGFRVARTIVE